jgi:hypothetical protein
MRLVAREAQEKRAEGFRFGKLVPIWELEIGTGTNRKRKDGVRRKVARRSAFRACSPKHQSRGSDELAGMSEENVPEGLKPSFILSPLRPD